MSHIQASNHVDLCIICTYQGRGVRAPTREPERLEKLMTAVDKFTCNGNATLIQLSLLIIVGLNQVYRI